ncbi:aquaporin sip2.1, putative [Ricinus communis]|uniref:Aquaporin sip2.1, putative n=1 Tax=Ricinus communis TaxID=3988 RepID=B9SFQ3_RICCO|nr:aquaporin sip2.1, putative [Ricinus communis]|eukprot:XP_002524822.1 aquaporin SIP1-1 isoform X1 [Ricinus communis]
MGVIKSAVGDAVLTSIWVFTLPFLGVLTSIVSTYVGVEPRSIPGLFITINLATLLYLMFSFLGAALGGASFNPATTVTLYASGLRPDASLMSMAVRFPAQAAGGVSGAMAILQAMPRKYKHLLKGPSLKVDLHTGAIAEGVLSFMLCLAFLSLMSKGPKNSMLKLWLLACVITGLAACGAKYTGPSLNPANVYGWAYVHNWHNSWELFYVYWIGPLVGATLSAWVFRFLFKPSSKQKQA